MKRIIIALSILIGSPVVAEDSPFNNTLPPYYKFLKQKQETTRNQALIDALIERQNAESSLLKEELYNPRRYESGSSSSGLDYGAIIRETMRDSQRRRR